MKYMILLAFAGVLLFCLTVIGTITSCNKPLTYTPRATTVKSNDRYCNKYQTIVIDSCEYVFEFTEHSSWGSHKGNCRFCASRARATQRILASTHDNMSALVDSEATPPEFIEVEEWPGKRFVLEKPQTGKAQ
jgi:hypothetical protein